MRRLSLRSFQSPGDVVMLAAAVRDLHAACPGQFLTDVRTSADALWLHNRHITRLEERDPGVQVSEMHYPLIHHSNQRPYHFIDGYASGECYDTDTLINAVSITKFDEAGNVLEQIRATRASTAGKRQASDTFARSSYVAWTTNQYTERCVLDSTRVYHTIPASGEGQSGTHYDQTDFQYNASRIRNWHKTPGGTITFTVLDARGNTSRPASITYPDGRVITYSYGAADSMNDALSRISSIVDDDTGSTHLADYSYLGVGPAGGLLPSVNSPFAPGAVEVDYTEPDIKYTLVGTAGGNDPDTGDIYRGLDGFGRIKDCYWYNYGSSTDVDRIKYGYDRNGNRTYRENTVATAAGAYFDEKYLHDLIDRLKSMDRGQLTAQKDSVTNKTFAQRWGLDATGNWRSFLEDSDGNGAWNLDQTRTANKVNEIADITESTGPSWVTPDYNRAGNMTTIPRPADPTQSFTATYDAWNRLIKIEEGANKVAEYEYDGAKRRTVKKTYVSGQLDETRHFFYTDPSRWQVVEERVGSSTSADRQFVWGLRYVDDLILRDGDTNADVTLDERLYGMQDANWNVTSIANTSSAVQERYAYHAYGSLVVLTATFGPRASSAFDWETTFAGYRYDRKVQLYHIRNRVLSSNVGWLQRDPLRYEGGPSLYSYVRSEPTILQDPTGEYAIGDDVIAGVIGCGIVGGWSIITSLVQGNSFLVGACKAGISCAFGALAGWATLYFPAAEPCFIGAAAALGASLGQAICQPCPADWECVLWGAFAGAIFGCLGGLGLTQFQIVNILKDIGAAGVGTLWDFDVYNLCRWWSDRPMFE